MCIDVTLYKFQLTTFLTLNTPIAQQLEQEYARFIEFGNLLDVRSRRYLVEHFKHKLSGEELIQEELNDRYFRYFRSSLDKIFVIDDLLELCAKNERISKQVVLDTLYWMRKTFEKAQLKNPWQRELDTLKGWAITPMKAFQARYPFLIKLLRETYGKEELDAGFYEEKFRRFFVKELEQHTKEEKDNFELIFTDLLSQWDALLQAKLLDYQLKKMEEEREQFTEMLDAKVKEYKQLQSLITPFTDYLGWDMSRELWNDTSFDVLREYDDLLQDEKSIKELADLLGDLRDAEIEMEEETFEKTIVRQEWKTDEFAKAEIVGVHESRDLNNLVSSEVGLLSDDVTEDLFLKKYADQGLLTFRFEDRKLVSSKHNIMEVHQKVRQKEKGPFIICVDTSESMMGDPERIAKVLCLGVLKMAVKDNRSAYLINFSAGIKTINLYNIADSINEIAKFLRMSFYGGTDVSLALSETMRQLKTNDYRDADVLMISDFIMYKIDDDVLSDIRYFQHNKGTEFHSLTLSNEANSEILQRFDTNWVYDPKKKGIIKELTRGLGTIGERI